jgi:hypothetical protein
VETASVAAFFNGRFFSLSLFFHAWQMFGQPLSHTSFYRRSTTKNELVDVWPRQSQLQKLVDVQSCNS